MAIQEHLHGLLLKLLGKEGARLGLFGLRLGHRTVLPFPLKIRSWTVHKKPSTSEGLPDALALAGMLPAGHIAVSTSGSSFPATLGVELFAGKFIRYYPDRDVSGQSGGKVRAERIVPVANNFRLIDLPYPITENHGKDVRDSINEGGSWAFLESLAAAARPITVADLPPAPKPYEGTAAKTAGVRKYSSADDSAKWDAVAKETLQLLDVEAEYRLMGVEIVGRKASAAGWLTCRAVGREDKKPSAAINVGTGPCRGMYKDLASKAETKAIPLFKFARDNGGKRLSEYARQVAVTLPKSELDELAGTLLLPKSPPSESPAAPPQPAPTEPPQTPHEARGVIEAAVAQRKAAREAWEAAQGDPLTGLDFGAPDTVPRPLAESASETAVREAQKETDGLLRAELLEKRKTIPPPTLTTLKKHAQISPRNRTTCFCSCFVAPSRCSK